MRTHSDDILLMLLDLLRQLIGSTPVGSVCARHLNLHKGTHCHTTVKLYNYFMYCLVLISCILSVYCQMNLIQIYHIAGNIGSL